jgi:hypothetical protein
MTPMVQGWRSRFIVTLTFVWRVGQRLHVSHRYGVDPPCRGNQHGRPSYFKETRLAPRSRLSPKQRTTVSGAGFLLVAPQSRDLITKLLGSPLVAAR